MRSSVLTKSRVRYISHKPQHRSGSLLFMRPFARGFGLQLRGTSRSLHPDASWTSTVNCGVRAHSADKSGLDPSFISTNHWRLTEGKS